MPATLMDGKAIAKEIREQLAVEVAEFTDASGVKPCLAAVLMGEDAASQVYVRNKRRACEKAGIDSQLYSLPAETSEEDLLSLIERLTDEIATSAGVSATS